MGTPTARNVAPAGSEYAEMIGMPPLKFVAPGRGLVCPALEPSLKDLIQNLINASKKTIPVTQEKKTNLWSPNINEQSVKKSSEYGKTPKNYSTNNFKMIDVERSITFLIGTKAKDAVIFSKSQKLLDKQYDMSRRIALVVDLTLNNSGRFFFHGVQHEQEGRDIDYYFDVQESNEGT
ncbi:hypothetical protein TNCV_145031 [Trichonephila clavipes]|nr:hypothetical protein TNCV_145031 [Trichonephila clavipes]